MCVCVCAHACTCVLGPWAPTCWIGACGPGCAWDSPCCLEACEALWGELTRANLRSPPSLSQEDGNIAGTFQSFWHIPQFLARSTVSVLEQKIHQLRELRMTNGCQTCWLPLPGRGRWREAGSRAARGPGGSLRSSPPGCLALADLPVRGPAGLSWGRFHKHISKKTSATGTPVLGDGMGGGSRALTGVCDKSHLTKEAATELRPALQAQGTAGVKALRWGARCVLRSSREALSR